MTRRGEIQLKKGPEREAEAKRMAAEYNEPNPKSIRRIAAELDRSYTFVYELLKEAGVTFRGRGGNQRLTREQWDKGGKLGQGEIRTVEMPPDTEQ
jgi:hypothetical protein